MTVAVYGDAPYGTTPTDTSQSSRPAGLHRHVNADPNVSLVIHVGDIHSGKQFCTEAYDRTSTTSGRRFQDPLVYTPGDNEWTDCHKQAEGGGAYNAATGQIDYVLDASGNPVDYAKRRSDGEPRPDSLDLLPARPGVALGGRKKQVLSQAQSFDPPHPTDAKFVENVHVAESQVLFVTINLPGGSNNDTDVWYGAPTADGRRRPQESARAHRRRSALARHRLRARAGGRRRAAWSSSAQADMWDPEKGAAHQAGYEPFVQSVAAHTLAFGKPVLMFNGDSHVYRSDNPLVAPSDSRCTTCSCTPATTCRTSTASSCTAAPSRSSG